jgi:tRNA (mo5U34)-methyltransferase
VISRNIFINTMDLDRLRKERESWSSWKNIIHRTKAVEALPQIEAKITISDTITIESDDKIDNDNIYNTAKILKPWRKGPFKVFDTFIDTEWQSNLKYNLLIPHVEIKDKRVADVGCNNGYYMFRMLEEKPAKIVGFDPSAIFKAQFDFINHFIKSDIEYELLGIEHIPYYEYKFETIFCLGVLYHRPDPIKALKDLAKGLVKGGELILDTFMIDGDEEIALSPKDRYSKIPNIYFIPTIPALKNWLNRAGFIDIEIIDIVKTTTQEQRATQWVDTQSLEDFLDPNDSNKTVEGYPAPKRVYLKAKVE